MQHKLILVHFNGEEKEIEILSYYPPSTLIFKWGIAGMYSIDLRKKGSINQIVQWYVKDMKVAKDIYAKLSYKLPEKPIEAKDDDKAANQHWRNKGLIS